MKQRKIAISLAVVAAIAAPFVSRTYKAQPVSKTWVPMTAEMKEELIASQKRSSNCRKFVDQLQQLGKSASIFDAGALDACREEQKILEERGQYLQRPSTLLYLALNAAAAVVGFVLVFGLTFLLPALARRYWRWLNG
jgi:hypothetical protein